MYFFFPGAASVAKAISTYFDQLINNAMSNFFQEKFPMDISFLAPHVDIFPLIVTVLFASKILTLKHSLRII